MKSHLSVLVTCGFMVCLVSTVHGFGLKNMFAAIQRRSENELQAPIDNITRMILRMADANKDDRITFSEIRNYLTAFFDDRTARYHVVSETGFVMTIVTFIDENHDEILERNEIRKCIDVFAGLTGGLQLAKLVQIGLRVDRHFQENTQSTIATAVNILFKTMDTDNNGLISEDERDLLMSERVEGLGEDAKRSMLAEDWNRDGVLDKSEATSWVELFYRGNDQYHVYYTVQFLKTYFQIKEVVGDEIANLWIRSRH